MKIKRFIEQLALVALAASAVGVTGANAAGGITSRSDLMGSAAASATTTHQISFTTASSASIGSVSFTYCTTAYSACVVPAGLSTTTASLSSQSGTGGTGFSIVNGTNGAPYVTRSSSAIGSSVALSYTLSGVVNPSSTNTEFYVRVATYTGTDGATGVVDNGVIAISTSQEITVTGTMPESLVFCVGTAGTDCTNMTGSAVGLGIFSPAVASTGTSVMSASTNASFGYAITITGTTMQSGANTLPAMGTQTQNSSNNAASATGSSQFGTNVRANTTPAVGSDVSGSGTAVGQGGYNTVNGFRFMSGDIVAGVAGPTNANLFTNTYLVNVGGNQAAGVYTSTFTYICTATF
ncbi:hypothetical protein HJC99_04485 [Candidatus Saccharibacteria bacterium]|nr:hypothetical protein [Candidatus Saccharibacteria bacterium]